MENRDSENLCSVLFCSDAIGLSGSSGSPHPHTPSAHTGTPCDWRVIISDSMHSVISRNHISSQYVTEAADSTHCVCVETHTHMHGIEET